MAKCDLNGDCSVSECAATAVAVGALAIGALVAIACLCCSRRGAAGNADSPNGSHR